MKESSQVAQYLAEIERQFRTGHAQEHSYRPALEVLFKETTKLRVLNEPKGSAHGRPDFIFLKGDVPIAWVEAKDLHVNLDKVEKSEQMARYYGYPNLILTNGLEFRFFRNGQSYGASIIVATKHGETITPTPETYGLLASTIADFVADTVDTILSAEHLAKIMGGKARRLRDNILDILDPAFTGKKGDIENVMQALKTQLIHDLSIPQFADLYAQTLVYGLFVARYHDDKSETFSRMEARDKIPANNHLLQQFFDHIAGVNFIAKLSFIVDELCDVFAHSNVHDLVHGLYQQMSIDGQTHDPIIHFYEDFLREYDPQLRMSRGVFYTPLPVVRYIVKSVDALLKEHFGLSEGLADRATIDWTFTEQGKKSKRTIDRVQMLDPAVGTGTFLNEIVRTIHDKYFKGQEGSWPAYVNDHLIPRLHGFELMMASYTIAHLKLSMTLAETGVKNLKKRLRIFLTNSLEEAPDKDDTLFGSLGLQGALTEEAQMAHEVKRDYPIMVVLGNPPYSGESNNDNDYISSLMDAYKVEPGGKQKLQEKNSKWLNDDYVKFIRFAESLIEKNGEGIVAMITNHGYLGNPTFRGMRWHLLNTFNEIYVIDLHGNSKKHETAPDGTKDENVFDIQQGVSILMAIRKKGKKGLGNLQRFDLYGKREEKYAWLETHDKQTTPWRRIECDTSHYFFKQQNSGLKKEYDTGISLKDFFLLNGTGIVTKRDELVIHHSAEAAYQSADDMLHLPESELRQKYHVAPDVRDWRYEWAQKDVRDSGLDRSLVRSISYRPFDRRYLYYTGRARGFMGWPVDKIMRNMRQANFGLVTARGTKNPVPDHFFVSKEITETKLGESSTQSYFFPLYLYPNSATLEEEKRVANLKLELLSPVLKKLKLEWILDGIGDAKKTCGPEDIFDYIYAVLHSSSYRSRYKEFLKNDFPNVPFTSNAKLFWLLILKGREIRLLHLMESPILKKLITQYPNDGSNVVEKVSYDPKHKRVQINPAQYFDGIEPEVWNFPIGGYQPLQKWLKDRKGRTLTSDDLLHYQRIVVALKETARLMKEIDAMIEKNGGWPMK